MATSYWLRATSQGLPDQLRAQLNDARIRRRRDFAEAAAAERAAWRIPVRFVQYVEKLASELKPHTAWHRDVLEDRQIKHAAVWTDHRRASRVPEAIGCWNEALRGEEPLNRALAARQIRIAHHVGPHGAIRSDAEGIARSKHGDWEPRLPLVNPVHLPVADDLIHDARHAVAEPPVAAERQVVHERGDETVFVMVGRQPPVGFRIEDVLDAVACVVVAAAERLRVAQRFAVRERVDERDAV